MMLNLADGRIQTWSEIASSYDGEPLFVPEGVTLTLDADADLSGLVLRGELRISGDNLTLETDWIAVLEDGLLNISGPNDTSFSGQLSIKLTGTNDDFVFDPATYLERPVTGWSPVPDPAFLIAHGNNARIRIDAEDKFKTSWTQLSKSAAAGDRKITIGTDTGWEIGDRIVIASTDFDLNQAEEFVIEGVSLDGRTITLNQPLHYGHYGEIHTYSNGKSGTESRNWDVDMRAEVGLLSRNVKISGTAETEGAPGYGHIMASADGSIQIEGAELAFLGQNSQLGRYGVHWHLLGDKTGDFIKDSTIRNTANKAITLHGTQNVSIENNVIFETIGHSIFMEDAAEYGNSIIGNLVLGTRADKINPLNTTDSKLVSSFWIENPDNVIRGNHAAGSEHTGFWFAPSPVHGLSSLDDNYAGLTPHLRPINEFTGNTAHSNFSHNLAIEGQSTANEFKIVAYSLTEPWFVEDFTAYKSEESSIWVRAYGGNFVDIKSSDNMRATFFSFTQTLEDSVIVGRSDNTGNPDDWFEIQEGRSLPTTFVGETGKSFRGHSLYDGPTHLSNVHFVGFNADDDAAITVNGASHKSPVHSAEGITFADDAIVTRRVDFSPASHREFMWGSGLLDLDGSIIGRPGIITPMVAPFDPNGSRINAGAFSVPYTDWSSWITPFEGRSDIARLHIRAAAHQPEGGFLPHYDLFRIAPGERYEAPQPSSEYLLNQNPTEVGNVGHYQHSVILGTVELETDEYVFQPHQLTDEYWISMDNAPRLGSVIYSLRYLPSDASVGQAASVASYDELIARTENAWFRDADFLYVKLVATIDGRAGKDDLDEFQDRFWRSSEVHIVTGAADGQNPVIADFETQTDIRGQLDAINATTGEIQAVWQDTGQDGAVSFDVISNGDGVFGYVDYIFGFAPADWRSFDSLVIDTEIHGSGDTYSVFLRSSNPSFHFLGEQGVGEQKVSLGAVPDAKLGSVNGLYIRVEEEDFAANTLSSGEVSRLILKSISLEARNDAPIIAPVSDVTVTEGTAETGITASASDNDGDIPAFFLGGADEGAFFIHQFTGEVYFRNTADFERPRDINRDNVYEFTIRAEDGTDKSPEEEVRLTVENAEADTHLGTANDDTLGYDNSDDTIMGFAGDDFLRGDPGNDYLDGGFHNDIVVGGEGNDVVIGGHGNDSLYGSYISEGGHSNESNTLDGGDGDDEIFGSDGPDTIYGGAGNEHLTPNDGSDLVDGGPGRDTLKYIYSSASVTVDLMTGEAAGGDGIDILSDIEDVWGSFHPDIISGDNGSNELRGYDGDDSIAGLSGRDFIYGQDGADSLDGGHGDDEVYGGSGEDTVVAGDGNDYLRGDDGEDILRPGLGRDTILSGTGQDTIVGGLAELDTDTIADFTGSDTLWIEGISLRSSEILISEDSAVISVDKNHDGAKQAQVVLGGSFTNRLFEVFTDGTDTTISLAPNNTTLLSPAGERFITQDAAPNRVYGDAGDDFVLAGGGADLVKGGAGSDVLLGGTGNDTLGGGAGNDELTGGAGADDFVVSARDFDGFGVETITDFTPGEDRIVLAGFAETSFVTFGSDVAIDTGVRGFVLLKGVLESELNSGDVVTGPGIGFALAATAAVHKLTEASDRFVTTDGGPNVVHAGGDQDSVLTAGGADLVLGEAGSDFLLGGAGDDTVVGGAGNDVLSGGPGADRFEFAAGATGFINDTITDFEIGEDVVALSGYAAPVLLELLGSAAAQLSATEFVVFEGVALAELEAAEEDVFVFG